MLRSDCAIFYFHIMQFSMCRVFGFTVSEVLLCCIKWCKRPKLIFVITVSADTNSCFTGVWMMQKAQLFCDNFKILSSVLLIFSCTSTNEIEGHSE